MGDSQKMQRPPTRWRPSCFFCRLVCRSLCNLDALSTLRNYQDPCTHRVLGHQKCHHQDDESFGVPIAPVWAFFPTKYGGERSGTWSVFEGEFSCDFRIRIGFETREFMYFFLYVKRVFPFFHEKHIFLISCLTDDWCFCFKKNIVIEFFEKSTKRNSSFFDHSFWFWDSSFSKILSSYLKLRFEKEKYFCIFIWESGEFWEYLFKRYKGYINCDNSIFSNPAREFSDIHILKWGYFLIIANICMKLVTSHIDRIDILRSSFEEHLSETSGRWSNI